MKVVARNIKANSPISSFKAKYQGTAIILIPCAMAEIVLAENNNKIAVKFFMQEFEGAKVYIPINPT